MITENELNKRKCLELLVEQNPMLDKDSILALYNDIKNSMSNVNSNNSLISIIEHHEY